MIRVNAINPITGFSGSSLFNNEEEADLWILKETKNKSYGDIPQFTKINAESEAIQIAIEKSVSQDKIKGEILKTKISALMRQKLLSGHITIEQLSSFVESDEVKKVERYLKEGYLTLVVPVIQGAAFDLLTENEKQYFLSELL